MFYGVDHNICGLLQPNAGAHLLPEAEAERTL
jgi:hypothetical protein